MTIDEAIASGLFDMPDEPGMVRIPISINVMIPNHLLWPPQPPEDHPSDYDDLDDAPPPMTAEGHAARKIAESFHTMIGPGAAEARASFRDMLKVMHGGGRRAAPVQAASADQAMDPRRPDADRDRSSPVERSGPGCGRRTAPRSSLWQRRWSLPKKWNASVRRAANSTPPRHRTTRSIRTTSGNSQRSILGMMRSRCCGHPTG